MSQPAAARPTSLLRRRPRSPAPAAPASPGGARPFWRPVWSVPAAIRAVRATIVVPGLLAVGLYGIGDPQVTLFAVFGGFASLVLASFGGTRRDKLTAYLGLGVVSSVALTVGTLVSSTAWLAAIITIPLAFAIFFAGVIGPNLATAVTPALLAYILPVATRAPASAIGPRLAGWWLALAASTIAVLLLSPTSPGDRLRASAAASARALSRQLARGVDGTATEADADAAESAKHQLIDIFAATPLRPTGLAAADQALASVTEGLEWCTGLVGETITGHQDLGHAAAADRELLAGAAEALTCVADLLEGRDVQPDVDRLERARKASAQAQQRLSGTPDEIRTATAHAAHAQAIAVAVRSVALDSLIAARRADPDLVEDQRRRWYGRQDAPPPARLPALAAAGRYLSRHASIRSVLFRNSLRGATALAVAVAVADLTGVQHGFWVVFGTLSVLRTSAAATEATVLRALGGTALGFAVGAALLVAIGTGSAALWVVLPIAVLIASYAPGTAPFAVGQAAFTVVIVVVFNLLVPLGWQVGLLRIEDVGIGCAVSIVVGLLFWPRGATAIVGADLADAYRRGGAYLSQSVDWALGLRDGPPDTAVAAVTAGIRLDEALRAYLSEQGTKRVSKSDLWRLVLGSTRLRLTAYAMASLHDVTAAAIMGPGVSPGDGPGASPGADPRAGPAVADGPGGDSTSIQEPADGPRSVFRHLARDLVVFYDQIAAQLSGAADGTVAPATVPALSGPALPVGVACGGTTPPDYQPDMLWVGEYLYHLGEQAGSVTGPAAQIAGLRRLPWWR